jgi:hypothetical protein
MAGWMAQRTTSLSGIPAPPEDETCSVSEHPATLLSLL